MLDQMNIAQNQLLIVKHNSPALCVMFLYTESKEEYCKRNESSHILQQKDYNKQQQNTMSLSLHRTYKPMVNRALLSLNRRPIDGMGWTKVCVYFCGGRGLTQMQHMLAVYIVIFRVVFFQVCEMPCSTLEEARTAYGTN